MALLTQQGTITGFSTLSVLTVSFAGMLITMVASAYRSLPLPPTHTRGLNPSPTFSGKTLASSFGQTLPLTCFQGKIWGTVVLVWTIVSAGSQLPMGRTETTVICCQASA